MGYIEGGSNPELETGGGGGPCVRKLNERTKKSSLAQNQPKGQV